MVAPGAGHDTDEGGERRDAEHQEDLVTEAAQLPQGRVLAVQHGAGEEVLEEGGSWAIREEAGHSGRRD